MRFVAAKSVEQQAALSLHRTRDLLVRQRTRLVNMIRGMLAELGIVLQDELGRTLSWSGRRSFRRSAPSRTPSAAGQGCPQPKCGLQPSYRLPRWSPEDRSGRASWSSELDAAEAGAPHKSQMPAMSRTPEEWERRKPRGLRVSVVMLEPSRCVGPAGCRAERESQHPCFHL
jgi:hypothetical protein